MSNTIINWRFGTRHLQIVLCGWLPRCKRRFDDLAHWSGAVLCPAWTWFEFM